MEGLLILTREYRWLVTWRVSPPDPGTLVQDDNHHGVPWSKHAMIWLKNRSCKHKKGKSLELGSLWFMVTLLISIDDHSPLWIYNGCSKTWEFSMNRAHESWLLMGASQSTKGGFTMLHTLLYIDADCRFFWDSPSSISTHRLKQFYLSMWFSPEWQTVKVLNIYHQLVTPNISRTYK